MFKGVIDMMVEFPCTNEEVFLYNGKKVVVKDAYLKNKQGLVMIVDGIEEKAEATDEGFLTGTQSRISIIFGAEGTILVRATCAREFADRQRKFRFLVAARETSRWHTENKAARAGLLYGTIEPGAPEGWYAVLMMKVASYGGYIDYSQPHRVFLGEVNDYCEKIRKNRGIDDVYHHHAEYLVTLLTKAEVVDLLN